LEKKSFGKISLLDKLANSVLTIVKMRQMEI
jgi:hypothetical protein